MKALECGATAAGLLDLLLPERWQQKCEIIPDYMPPYPQEDTRPSCVVVWRRDEDRGDIFLRYSKGPRQGFSWDVYGDDMHTVELAVIALSKAPHPSALDNYPMVFKLPLPSRTGADALRDEPTTTKGTER